jgi:hypothetical protein
MAIPVLEGRGDHRGWVSPIAALACPGGEAHRQLVGTNPRPPRKASEKEQPKRLGLCHAGTTVEGTPAERCECPLQHQLLSSLLHYLISCVTIGSANANANLQPCLSQLCHRYSEGTTPTPPLHIRPQVHKAQSSPGATHPHPLRPPRQQLPSV